MSKSDIQTLRMHMAMVFQNSNLYRNKTAVENVIEPLITVRKMNKGEALQIADELLAKVGMSHKKMRILKLCQVERSKELESLEQGCECRCNSFG